MTVECRHANLMRGKHRAHPRCPFWIYGRYTATACGCRCHDSSANYHPRTVMGLEL